MNPNSAEAVALRRVGRQIAPIFNEEIRRIARAENKTDGKSMRLLMAEIAAICHLQDTRMVYHWRSGFHPLPAEHVPALCKRFKSYALLEAIKALEIEIEIPDNFDLALEANRALQEDLAFHERLLASFQDAVVTPGELLALKELEARAHRNLHLMFGIAEANCCAHHAEVRSQKSEVSIRRKPEVRSQKSVPGAVATGSTRKRAAR